ncbi:MAG: class I tRNA ligase family protein, partial [Candidatus Omnitrophica bacterium]|nr:class I tRNA ligase family protein [Candidatus Omnitrophota bacterium]
MEKKPNYKDTLNLPQTQLPMRANLPQREPEILKRWQEMDIYKAILTSSGDRPRYVLHDGPPYANGHIHMGHVLNKVLKDIILKYKTMRGYSCPFIPGWDCHGLPVEHQLFKELGMTKDEISRGVFRKKAKKYALKHVNIQRKEFERLGVFADWDNPYLTLNNNYEAQIVKSFSRLVKKGFIYKGRKPVNWCYHCETALAEAEVEYDERRSPSIFVKFKLASEDKKQLAEKAGLSGIEAVGSKEIYFIIWTTTPWTLLANIGVALSPALKYSLVAVNNELWILADALVPALSGKLKMEGCQKVAEVDSGSAFAGLRCEHPLFNRQSVILPAEYVSGEEGTGCVHLAPGHGQDDY